MEAPKPPDKLHGTFDVLGIRLMMFIPCLSWRQDETVIWSMKPPKVSTPLFASPTPTNQFIWKTFQRHSLDEFLNTRLVHLINAKRVGLSLSDDQEVSKDQIR